MTVRLTQDERGGTLAEFAIVLPALLTLLLGAFDLGHTLYVKSVAQGAMQKAGRDSSLESANPTTLAALDGLIRSQVQEVAAEANVQFTRRFYKSFDQAAAKQPEPFSDTNGNGRCDPPAGATPGEPFTDVNRNGRWDADGADDGQGGAKDSVVYTATITYPHIVPIGGFLTGSQQVNMTVSTVLNNQPFNDQQQYGTPLTGNCS